MGSTHYNLYRMMEDVTLVALVDVERERVEGKAADCGARWYTSFSEMLEKESPDYVDIATPSYTHAELALQALSKGIPVLTEKPAALCPEDVERMYRCAEEHGARIIGLSALMTTTMVRMEDTIALIRERGLDMKVMVGGAAVTQAFADSIGADAYCEDAVAAVRAAKSFLD